jgi:hypothetical protein
MSVLKPLFLFVFLLYFQTGNRWKFQTLGDKKENVRGVLQVQNEATLNLTAAENKTSCKDLCKKIKSIGDG